MKRTWMTMIFAVAMTAASAFAANATVKVPFDFSVNGMSMAAGSYEVTRVNGYNYVLQLRNRATQKAAIIAARHALDRPAAKPPAQLVFSCRAAGCAIQQVFLPGESVGHSFPTAPLKPGDKERRVAIAIHSLDERSGF